MLDVIRRFLPRVPTWVPVLAAAALSVSLFSGVARAETEGNERARTSWREGQTLFNAGRYKEAMAEFAEGYALSHRAAFLFNMAECARLLDDRPLAHRLYLRYLTYHPQSQGRDKAKQRCVELGVGPCTVAPAKPKRVPSPAAQALAAPAPGRSPAARRGPRQTLGEEARPRSSLQPAAQPLPSVPDETRREQPKPFYKRWPLWVGVGLAVVAGGVTASILATRSGDRSIPAGDRYLDLGQ